MGVRLPPGSPMRPVNGPCTLTLIMSETQYKGDVALSKAISTFTILKYIVSLPITDSAPYDLIIDDGFGLYRVQCKYSSSEKYVDLRRIHSNAKGYVIKRYKNSFDWLYVFHSNGKEYLIKENLDHKTYFRLNDKYLLDDGTSGLVTGFEHQTP
jgi:hypothetical protein